MYDRWIRGYWELVPVIVKADAVIAVHAVHAADPFPFSVVVDTRGTEMFEANESGTAPVGMIASSRDLLCPLEWKLACDWLDGARHEYLNDLGGPPQPEGGPDA